MTYTEIFNKENIVTAHYVDEEYTNIEVLYSIGEEIHVYVLPADPEDNDYKALVKAGWDANTLAEHTTRYKREQRRGFEAMVVGIAEADGLSINNLQQDEVFDLVIDTMTKELDEESLFRFKLKIFDNKAVKAINDRGIKAEIRKAKSIPEVIAAFLKI